jgi:integrase
MHNAAIPVADRVPVKATMRGIRRRVGTAPKRKAPATADKICAMAANMPDGLIGLRDRALLLLGFAGAFRRSELVALNVADIQECEAGLRVRISRSKTDQEAQGVTIGFKMMDTSRHKSVDTLRAYVRDAELFRDHASAGLL